MKLCIVLNNLLIGGSERKIINVANHMTVCGWDVTLIGLKPEHNEGLLKTVHKDITIYLANTKLSIIKYFIKNRFNSFFLLNSYPALFSPLFRLLNKNSNISFLNNTSELPNNYSSLKLNILRYSIKYCDNVVYGAKKQRDMWITQYGFPSSNSTVLYNGVNTDIFRRVSQTKKDQTLNIIMVGQLRIEKNYVEAITVFNQLNEANVDFTVKIIGGGNTVYKGELITLIKKLSLEGKVELVGEAQNVKIHLEKANTFLLSSNAVETFSNSALEAMSMSLCVVISDIGGANEMVKSGNDGIVYNNTEDLFNSLMSITDPNLRNHLANNARDTVVNRFSQQDMFHQYTLLASGELAC